MYAILDCPSNLGLRPSGVENLPAALRRAGLAARLGARDAGRIVPAVPYDAARSPETGILNGPALRETSVALAHAVAGVIAGGDVPIVLAGDCSVLLGGLLGAKLAMRSASRSDRVGLLFIDGHVDFYQPDTSPTGEVADMDLAIATGRGPAILTTLDGSQPLVREEDVAAVGARDASERREAGSQDVESTRVRLFELPAIRRCGIDSISEQATKVVGSPFWCHLDADVLADEVMPAVDYRQPGGLTPAELSTLLRTAAATNRMAGLSVAIYNPALDPAGDGARLLVDAITDGIGPSTTTAR